MSNTVSSPEDFALELLREEEEQRADRSVGEVVTIPGTKLKVRLQRAQVADMAVVGPLPRNLVERATGAMREKGLIDESEEGEESAEKEPEAHDPELIRAGTAQMIQMRDMVVRNCLEPRLVDDPLLGVGLVNAEGRFITKLKPDWFAFMLEWITGQRGYEDGLDSFRAGQAGGTSDARAGRKKRRHPREPTAARPVSAPGV